MPGKAFIDSNILIYAVGEDDARRAIANALIVQDAVVSVFGRHAARPIDRRHVEDRQPVRRVID